MTALWVHVNLQENTFLKLARNLQPGPPKGDSVVVPFRDFF